ncbi:hypothetical protein ABXT06_20775 [Flavobacterium sp. UW10123]|uniref:hypothetical protein n=1 Tax=Flavobacterium sp. UW10123 TaxID=3230800 RepID=UPI0033993312
MILEEEYYAYVDNSIINKIASDHSYAEELLFSAYEWSNYLKIYLLLTHELSVIEKTKLKPIDLLINRYYWFKKFYHNYFLTKGIDAGTEQQIFEILEEIRNQDNFDWLIIQNIDNEIENE